ncbi:MAG: gliding motility-associated C-terminal domain-containing protein [Brumimicrobium sp.]
MENSNYNSGLSEVQSVNARLILSKFTLISFILLISFTGFSQGNVNCTGDTPFFSVDLTGNPAGTWVSPNVVRDGECCGGGANQVNCIELSVTLDPNAESIIFNIESGANPGGALYYQVNCDSVPVSSGSEPICLDGVGPHLITYCKVGNNQNTYSITSVPSPVTSGDISITIDGSCSEYISAAGLDPNTISWNSISPGYSGEYNNLLSDDAGTQGTQGVPVWGVDSVLVTPDATTPSVVYYEVCGTPSGACSETTYCDTVAVNVYPSLDGEINPQEPAICFGGTSTTLTANPIGGTPPHTYDWSNGDTGQSTDITTPGEYSVIITDAIGCAIAYDTVTVVEFSEEITADAGPDILVCDPPTPTVDVNGAVTGTTTGVWSGGSGTYSPDATSLNLQYTPTASEMASGSVTLYLTTTNNATCPGDEDTVEIILPPYFSDVQLTPEDVSCFGDCDGWIEAQPNGGLAPFTYTWSDDAGNPIGQSGQTASGLCVGDYEVEVTDDAGCIVTASATINEPTQLAGNVTPTEATCNNVCDGEVEVTNTSGGTTPYEYNINNGANQTGTTFTGLCAGNQDVEIIDANNCTLELQTTINEPTPLDVNVVSITPATCGDDNATVVLEGNGGTTPYEFSIGGPNQTSTTFANVAPGNYTATVTDANNCTETTTFTVNTVSEPTAFVDDSTNLTCFGSNNGSVLIGTNNAVAPVTFSLNGGVPQASNSFNGLAAGNHSVEVVDANGCTVVVPFTITQPAQLAYTTTPTPTSCYGVCDGEATVSANGGTPPYQYSSDNGTTFTTDSVLTNLCPEPVEIQVVVQDDNSCLSNSTVVIDQPDSLYATFDLTDPVCFESCDGEIEINAIGGTAPYEFSENGNPAQTNNVLTGLCAGNIDLVVEDDNGCEYNATRNLVNPPEITIDQISMTPSNCGFNDGALEVEANGVNTPFLYSENGNPNQTSGVFNNLLAGAYSITATDTLGCQATEIFGVNDVEMDGELVDQTDVSCFGGNDGTVEVTNLAGSDPITFELDNSGTTQTNGNFGGLDAGNHIVTIYDAGFCVYNVLFTIDQPDEITFDTNIEDVTCFEGSDGEVNVINTAGGVGGYQYSIDGGFVFQGNTDFTGLTEGTYTIMVTDTNNCMVTGDAIVEEPSEITFTTNTFDLTCYNDNSGAIQIIANGGTGNFIYSIDNGTNFQGGSSFSGLSSNTYDIVVEDAEGCSENGTAVINEPDSLLADYTSIDANCFGECDGEIQINANGGTTPYLYSIDDGVTFATSNNFTSICADSYEIVVEDENNCFITGAATVDEPTEIVVSSIETPSTCGDANGEIDISASGGNPDYNYSIDNGANFSVNTNFNDLIADNYEIVVQDQNNCEVFADQEVTDQPAPVINLISKENPLCNGSADGEIDINASGGTGTLNYSLNGGAQQTSSIFTGLVAGSYTVEVVDQNGCIDTEIVELDEPDVLTLNINTTDLSCFENSTGGISITAGGGTPNYQYSIDNGVSFSPSSNFSFLSAGNYDIVLEDDNGCQEIGNAVINEPDALVITDINTTDPNCYESCDGSIDLTVDGGTTPYTYNWFGIPTPSTTNTAVDLCDGEYGFEIVDDNNCQVYSEAEIFDPAEFVLDSVQINNTSCFNDCDGEINVYAADGVDFTINGGAPQPNGDFTNLCAGSYLVKITNNDGCQIDTSFTITEPDELEMTLNSQNGVLCYGQTDTLLAYGNGGTLPYTYNWSSGDITNYSFVSPTEDTYYTVSITDVNGCQTVTDSVLIEVSEPLEATFTEDTTICANANVDLSIDGNGGQPGYEYYWFNQNETSQSINISTDTSEIYIASIADQCGQEIIDTINVNIFNDPDVSFFADEDVGCAPLEVEFTNTTASSEIGDNCKWIVDGTEYSGCDGFTHTFIDPTCYDVTFQMETTDGCDFEMVMDYAVCVVEDPIADFYPYPEEPTDLSNHVEFQNSSSGEDSYNWNFDDYGTSTEENPQVTFTGVESGETVKACLKVTSVFGCKDEVCKPIYFKPEFMVHVPNAFTPDGDDVNNTFQPVFPPDVDITQYELLIFNRWGEVLFESRDYNVGWDGTYGGKVAQDGVYIWKINLTEGNNNNKISLEGHVSLLK